MKKLVVLFAIIALSVVFYVTAHADVYQPNRLIRLVDGNYNGSDPATACTQTVDGKPVSYYHTTIQEAVDATEPGQKISICPGTYIENVELMGGWRKPTQRGVTISAYSVLDLPVVQAADPNKHVLYISNQVSIGVEVIGLIITGATGAECSVENGISVPCAGIRVYCTENVSFLYNHITGNNHGIIVKDTAQDWAFQTSILYNEIDNNIGAGVKLQYGYGTYVWNNNIHDNGTGIHLVDTWDNEIAWNTMTANGRSFNIERVNYDVNGNRIYGNTFEATITDNADCTTNPPIIGKTWYLNDWFKRKTPTDYEENTCTGSTVIQSNCTTNYYCNPIPDVF